MIPALAQMEHWFSEEELAPCPCCRAKKAIAEPSVLVCLACAAVSITVHKRAAAAREEA